LGDKSPKQREMEIVRTFIEAHYLEMNDRQMAEELSQILGRSVGQQAVKKQRLKGGFRKEHSDGLRYIEEAVRLAGTTDVAEVARALEAVVPPGDERLLEQLTVGALRELVARIAPQMRFAV